MQKRKIVSTHVFRILKTAIIIFYININSNYAYREIIANYYWGHEFNKMSTFMLLYLAFEVDWYYIQIRVTQYN